MDAFEFGIGEVLALAAFSYKVTSTFLSGGWEYRRARFGRAGDFLYLTRIVDTERLQEMHWNINLWTDNEVLAWRDSHVATCNAVSVAAAIFATIGLTALLLPDMYTVHWSARALCVTSMLLGVLSVMMSTSQQQSLAMLNNATSIRLWLSRGRPRARGHIEERRALANIYRQRKSSEATAHKETKFEFMEWTRLMSARMHEAGVQRPRTPGEWLALMRDSAHALRQQHDADFQIGWREQDKYKDVESFKGLPLESSISVLTAVAAPRHLLDLAVMFFLAGFGLYLLFQWLENMGDQPVANRNIFIFFTTSIGVFLLISLSVSSNMIDNQDKKAKEFDLAHLGGPHKPAALAQLEKELEDVRQRMQSLAEQQMNLAAEGADIESQIRSAGRTSQEASGVDSIKAPETA